MKQHSSIQQNHSGKFLIAVLLISAGVLMFARNMGWIHGEIYHLIVSWQTLLVFLGLYFLARRNYVAGVAVLLTGVYFLLGRLYCLPENSREMVWPVALIAVGIAFLFKAKRKSDYFRSIHSNETCGSFDSKIEGDESCGCHTSDGFLNSNNVFGGVRHVVLDEVFKGAKIRNSFGGTTIDLRHTHIEKGETIIDIECNWGGVELYIPSDWKVINQCSPFFGGCDDKRWQAAITDPERILIIRGSITFGGLEIRD